MKNLNIDSLEKLFNDVELYNRLDFDVYKIDAGACCFDVSELRRFLNVLGFKEKRITTRCKECKMNYPFDINVFGNYISFQMVRFTGLFLTDSCHINLTNKSINFNINTKFAEKDIIEDDYFYFEYLFKCTNEPDYHKYKMYVLVIKKGATLSIMKIGQYPSMIDVHGFDFDCYKKQLDSFGAYSDFKKAYLCIGDGFSAGAYTYLRRVFEKMLNKYCEGVSLKDNYTETKIKACKNSFDQRIHKLLPRLYKILSKGIHELDDSESQNYFEYLRIIITMQLEFVKENDDKDSQTKMLDDKLNDIISKIGD
ncbi:MAG: hypothetical protein J5666_00405 [Bacilli bacterium]|nr:hypothetical protein [Bacilli bacterium]